MLILLALAAAATPVAASLSAIHRLNPVLNAVIAVDPRARAAERMCRMAPARPGSLACLPILVKDNIDVAGLATTAGSLALRDNVALRSAPVVAALQDRGAV